MTARGADLIATRAGVDIPRLGLVRRSARDLIRRDGATRMLPIVIVAVIVVAAVVIGVLLEQVVLGQSAFKLADLRTRLTTAEARHEELLLQAAKLESPDRIESVARYSLGMVEPQEVGYLVADVRADVGARGARRGRASRLTRSAGLAVGIEPMERSP